MGWQESNPFVAIKHWTAALFVWQRSSPGDHTGLAAMLRSLYLRAKRPLQQQLRKMNETALERTEQSLKHQEDGRKLLQQDFLSNIYGPGFDRRREQIHSSLQVEKSLERRKDSGSKQHFWSHHFQPRRPPDELNRRQFSSHLQLFSRRPNW